MNLTADDLQSLVSLNLTTEQMATVLSIFAGKQRAMEERRAVDRERKKPGKSTETVAEIHGKSTETVPLARVIDNITSLTSLPVEEGSKEDPYSPRLLSKPLFEAEFDDLWPFYPKRSGNADRKSALIGYRAHRKRGIQADDIRVGILRYAAWCEATGKTGTELVRQMRTWLNKDGWKERYELPRIQTPSRRNGPGQEMRDAIDHVGSLVRSRDDQSPGGLS